MSQENVRLVQSLYDAFGRGDIGAVLALLDPQVVWNEAENFLYADGNPYIGPQAVLNGVLARVPADWDGFAATPQELLDAGDTVVSLGRYTGTCKASGTSIDAQFVHVFRIRESRIAAFQQYVDTAQLRDAMSQRASA